MDSECSSGCESGWTVYLDESYLSPNKYQASVLDDHHHQSYRTIPNADYEEDLSMVSDASSGPPHFHYGVEEEEEVECYRGARPYHPPSSSEKTRKTKKTSKEARAKNQHSFLDDTASSPAFTYPNVNRCTDPSSNQQPMDHHHHLFGYSQENGFMGNSAYGDQFGIWQSSHPKQQDSTESSSFDRPVASKEKRLKSMGDGAEISML